MLLTSQRVVMSSWKAMPSSVLRPLSLLRLLLVVDRSLMFPRALIPRLARVILEGVVLSIVFLVVGLLRVILLLGSWRTLRGRIFRLLLRLRALLLVLMLTLGLGGLGTRRLGVGWVFPSKG